MSQTFEDSITLLGLVMLFWFFGSVFIPPTQERQETATVTGIVKQYQGDNAPYEVLNVTLDGNTVQVTLSCDYYSKGSQINVFAPSHDWLIWPFWGFPKPLRLGSVQAGCNHS